MIGSILSLQFKTAYILFYMHAIFDIQATPQYEIYKYNIKFVKFTELVYKKILGAYAQRAVEHKPTHVLLQRIEGKHDHLKMRHQSNCGIYNDARGFVIIVVTQPPQIIVQICLLTLPGTRQNNCSTKLGDSYMTHHKYLINI